jgi:acyl carrier protein
MAPTAALAALQVAIEAGGRSQVTVMDMDWEQFLSAAPARKDAPLFAELQPLERELHEESPTRSGSAACMILENLRAVPAFERKSILAAHVRSSARRVLGLRETATVQDSIALQDLGMDSLMALEMRNDLSQSLGITLAAGLLFDYPTVEQLTRRLLGILEPTIGPVIEGTESGDAKHTSMELQSMSDEEAELLLIQELDRAGKEKAHV